jgi:hypothetical protein
MNNWPQSLKDIAWKNDYTGFERDCEFVWNYLPKDMRHYILGILFKEKNKSYKLTSKEFYQLYHKHNTNISFLIRCMKSSIYYENQLYLILFDQIRNIEIAKLQENRIKSKNIILFEFVRWCKVNQLTISPKYVTSHYRSLKPPNDVEIEHIYQFFLNKSLLLGLNNLIVYKFDLIKFFLAYKSDVNWIKTLNFAVQDVLLVCNFVSDKSLLYERLNGRIKFVPKIYQMVKDGVIIFTTKTLIESLCNVRWLLFPKNSGSSYDQRDEMKKLLDLFDLLNFFQRYLI